MGALRPSQSALKSGWFRLAGCAGGQLLGAVGKPYVAKGQEGLGWPCVGLSPSDPSGQGRSRAQSNPCAQLGIKGSGQVSSLRNPRPWVLVIPQWPGLGGRRAGPKVGDHVGTSPHWVTGWGSPAPWVHWGPLPRASGPSLGLPLPTDLRVSASHANQRKPGSSMPPQLVGMRPEVPVGGTGEQDGWQAEDLGRVSSVPRRSGWASDRTTAWKPHLPQGTGRASCSERWSPWGAWRP